MYAHKEAFALMRYRDDVTGAVEILWNSRDGVTPFTITSRAGNPATHVDYDLDQCVPVHTPALGSRVFVDLTMERARAHRTVFVERWWDSEVRGMKMSDCWDTKEAAIEALAHGDFDPPPGVPVGARYGQPDVVIVDEAFLDALRRSRLMMQSGGNRPQ